MQVRLAIMVFVIAGLARTAVAAETCHSLGHQFGKTRTCVNSVLPPRGERTYGPNHLIVGEDGTWCEGGGGPGIGQSVTIHMQPRQFTIADLYPGTSGSDPCITWLSTTRS